MAPSNDDYGFNTGANFIAQFGLGADLSVSSSAISVNNSLHFITGAGTITTINWSGSNSPSNPAIVILIRKSGASASFAAGGNISGPIPSVSDDQPIVAIWDGSSKWRLAAPSVASGASKWTSGNGSPEGVVTGNVGDLYSRLNGAGGSTLYIKEMGSGNTGWTAVVSFTGGHTGNGAVVLQGTPTIISGILNVSATMTGTSPQLIGQRDSAGANELVLGISNAANGIQAGTIAGGVVLLSRNSGTLHISADATTPAAIKIASTQIVTFAQPIVIGTSTVTSGNGSPEGAVAGNVGDVYIRKDGSHNSTYYLKESGAGTNTGWLSAATLGAALTMGIGRAADPVVRLALQQDANGPVLALDNTARANYVHFTKSTTNGAVDVGFLGSLEANVSYNMNYATGVHKYYDSAQNAMWMAINGTGFYLQYAPSGYGGTDMWSGQGSPIPFQVDGATGNTTQTGSATITATGLRITGGSGCVGAESTLHTWAGNGETITTATFGVARNTANGAARTGAILAVGTYAGQTITVVNEDGTPGNTLTFAASGTSHVANGVTSVINGLQARTFVWNTGTSLWYECK